MGRLFTLLAATLVVAAMVTAPASAKTPRPTPLYSTAVQMHFAGAGGKVRTITEHVYIDAGHGCPGPSIAVAEQMKHPDLQGMKLTGISCRDTAGASRPGGPAIVLLRYTMNGVLKTTVVASDGPAPLDMKTCPFLVQKEKGSFAAQIRSRFPGAKFVGASCMARPKYLHSFQNSVN